MKPRTVYVEWVDSAGTDDRWIQRDETLNPVKCITVGFMAEKTRTKVLIASSVTPGQWGGLTVIPRSAITKLRRLK